MMVDGAYGQFIAIGAGKAWINVPGSSAGEVVYRVDPATMKVDKTYRFINSPITPPPGPYQMVVDSKGNPYVTSLYASYIVRIDGATGTPTYWSMPGAGPRRGRMDSQDRFWFAQNLGDKIGMLDTRTEKFSEWPLPHKWTNPYAASVPDKNGYVYVSSNMSETVNRLDPRTGEIVSYLMPTNFDAKKIVHDPSTSRVALYMSNVRNARIVRVEPLD
jgi:virginiamycin B lyase